MTTSGTSFYREIRSLPRPVWTLAAGSFVDRFGTFVFPFLVLFLTAQGASKELAGIGAGCFGLGAIGAAFLGGYLSDRIGRRRTIAVSMFGGAAVALLLYAASVNAPALGGYWAAFLCAALYGLVRGLYHSAASSLLADLVPPGHRVAGFSVLRFAINFGWAIGMAIGGFVFEYSVFLLFAIDAVTSVIYGIVAVTGLPQGRRTAKEESGWNLAFRAILRDRVFLLVMANALIGAVVFMQWSSSYPVFLEANGFRPWTYGLIMALNGALIIVFELPLSAIVRRFHPPAVLAAGSVVAGIGFAINVFAGGMGWLILAMFIFSIGEMIALPMQAAYVSHLAPEKMRGRYNGMLGFMWSGGHVIGPVIGLAMLDIAPALLFVAMAALGFAGAVVLSFARVRKPESCRDGAVAVELES